MAEALPCDFDAWLKDTLIALNTDDEVFSPYIKGILEGEENKEEKVEALQGILTEITVCWEMSIFIAVGGNVIFSDIVL